MGECGLEKMWSCPVCGSAFQKGELSVVGYSTGKAHVTGSLWWVANEKIPRKRPLRLFGKTYFAEKSVKVLLMRGVTLFGDSGAPDCLPGWYCPNCKKIYAEFDAPNVPLELGGARGNL